MWERWCILPGRCRAQLRVDDLECVSENDSYTDIMYTAIKLSKWQFTSDKLCLTLDFGVDHFQNGQTHLRFINRSMCHKIWSMCEFRIRSVRLCRMKQPPFLILVANLRTMVLFYIYIYLYIYIHISIFGLYEYWLVSSNNGTNQSIWNSQ